MKTEGAAAWRQRRNKDSYCIPLRYEQLADTRQRHMMLDLLFARQLHWLFGSSYGQYVEATEGRVRYAAAYRDYPRCATDMLRAAVIR